MKGGEWAGLGEHLGGRGLVRAPLANVGILTESTAFFILRPPSPTALEQEVQAQLLLQTWTISLDLVSKVILGESGDKMTKLGWLLYLFGMERSLGSDPVLLFLAGCGVGEDSKQWGTLHSCLFCLLDTFPACHSDLSL